MSENAEEESQLLKPNKWKGRKKKRKKDYENIKRILT